MKTLWQLPRIEIASLCDVRDDRQVALFTSPPAWDALGGTLDLQVAWRSEPSDATEETFITSADALPAEAEVIYAVGGGLPFDSAKFAARQRGLPLIGVPTAISTDAPLTPASGIRRDGCVYYIFTGAADSLYIDWEIISAAPHHLRATGFAEMMAIAIGLWDWRFAEMNGRNLPAERLVDYAVGAMETMLEASLRIADRVGNGEVEALRSMLEMLALQVQLCNGLGHSRPQEGSEHYFAYSVENLTGHGHPHAELIGPGIVGMAAAQGQDFARLRDALEAVGTRLDRLSAEDVSNTLENLKEYSTRHRLAYGVAHALTPAQIDAAMTAMF